MELTSKNVLITGASGFIGSHLVEELVRRGNNVTALVHYNSRNDWGNLERIDPELMTNVKIATGNIEDPFCVQELVKKKDIVFHLAALIGIPYSYVAPLNYIKTNVEGTLNIMDACLKLDVQKVIHTSTSEVYGTALYTPIDEKHSLQGQSPYSASKIGADKVAESYYLSFGLPVSTIRPFNTFGPRQSLRAVIPTIISQALTSNTINLGSLDTVRSMNYVKNTVDGFIKIAESDRSIGEVINIGSSEAYSIGDIANMIFRLMDKDVRIVHDVRRVRPENSEVLTLVCDHSKAIDLVGWSEKIRFEDGLKRTIDWFSKYADGLKTNLYNV